MTLADGSGTEAGDTSEQDEAAVLGELRVGLEAPAAAELVAGTRSTLAKRQMSCVQNSKEES